MVDFLKALGNQFPIGKVFLEKEMIFNGVIIKQIDIGSKIMSMGRYMACVEPSDYSLERQKNRGYKASISEVKSLLQLSEKLIWPRCATLRHTLL